MNQDFISFSAKEAECMKAFSSNGPYWHITNNGNEMEVIFIDDDDYCFAVNALAISLTGLNVRVISFAIMSNHIHILAAGERGICLELFSIYKSKLQIYFKNKNRSLNWKKFTCDDPIPVTSIEMMRNEIAYIHRNAYVSRRDVTPYSYKWSSSYAYFSVPYLNNFPTVSSILVRKRREIFHMRDVSFSIDYHLLDNMILADDFCDIRLGMSFYIDAQQYFSKISKSYEAYSECAKRLGDRIFMTDDDIYASVLRICRNNYSKESLNVLTPDERIEIAKIIRSQYNATNNQIRRMLKIDIRIINELFGG